MTRKEFIDGLHVGSEVFVRDNFSYVRLDSGMYKKVKIDGETKRSWLIGTGYLEKKYPKKTANGLFSQQDIDDFMFIDENRHGVRERLSYPFKNADKLRRIIAILDEPEEK